MQVRGGWAPGTMDVGISDMVMKTPVHAAMTVPAAAATGAIITDAAIAVTDTAAAGVTIKTGTGGGQNAPQEVV